MVKFIWLKEKAMKCSSQLNVLKKRALLKIKLD